MRERERDQAIQDLKDQQEVFGVFEREGQHDMIGIFKKNHSDYSVENIMGGDSKCLQTYSDVKAVGKKDKQGQ